MKRNKTRIFGLIVLVLMVQPNLAVQQESGSEPMSSFMGAIWGVNALDFKNAFVYTIDLKWDKNFFLKNYKLAEVTFEKIAFVFLDKDGFQPKRLTKNVANSYFLKKIFITFKSYNFDFIYETFRYKYGKAHKVERDSNKSVFRIIWINKSINRMIFLNKFSDREGLSIAELLPYNELLLKGRKEKIKELAAKF